MDKVTLEVQKHRLEGIAEEMGVVLKRTAFSPNIKERRDYSCAIVNKHGEIVSQAAHIPVHLGAIPIIMEHVLNSSLTIEKDIGIITNDPYTGGTHLPDISFIMPWFVENEMTGFLINRAHHTDIGGSSAGSMAVSNHIDDEGFRTKPRIIYRDGELFNEDIQDLLNLSHDPDQRLTDLEAQIASAKRGRRRLSNWHSDVHLNPGECFQSLIDYTETYTKKLIKDMPNDSFEAQDVMDDDGMGSEKIHLHVNTTIEGGQLNVDYRDSDDQVKGNINCPRAVTYSATYFVIQSLLPNDIPINQGVLKPIQIKTRPGSLLDVEYPGAVAGGNVETSQRVVDVLLKSLSNVFPNRIPASGQGTMNNVSIGWSHNDNVNTYYETLGGGAGGGPEFQGISGRQVHMTNTLNTPIEEFERHFPAMIEVLRVRNNSGGDGEHQGGHGLIKEWRALKSLFISILSERRENSPFGLKGGESGLEGKNLLIKENETIALPSKTNVELETGQALRVETPGGGGWGEK